MRDREHAQPARPSGSGPAAPAAGDSLRFRTAEREDGPAIWRLVRESDYLDTNSSYCYLLFCEHFGHTTVVAEADGEVVGFVTAFRPPRRPGVVFVWQVGVDPDWRGRGIAGRLLRRLVAQDSCRGVTHLETTVTPSNRASQALFRSLARRLGTRIRAEPFFDEELFPGDDHEPEELYRIGPFEAPVETPSRGRVPDARAHVDASPS